MGKFLEILGKWIKTFLHFLDDLFNHLSATWQEEQYVRQQYRNTIVWNDVSQMILEELFLILKNSPYGFLNNMFCSDNIINAGWVVHNNNIVYHYDIYCSDPPNDCALEQIRQKLNQKIAQYQQQLIRQYGHKQTALSYPCIYYGMYITSIKRNGTMIHIEIVSHLSHITP